MYTIARLLTQPPWTWNPILTSWCRAVCPCSPAHCNPSLPTQPMGHSGNTPTWQHLGQFRCGSQQVPGFPPLLLHGQLWPPPTSLSTRQSEVHTHPPAPAGHGTLAKGTLPPGTSRKRK